MKTLATKLLFCCFLTALPILGFSQYEDEIPDAGILENEKKSQRGMREKKLLNLDNFFVGSGVGLNFGGNSLQFDFLPYFGYRLGDAIAPALGIDYLFLYDFTTQSETSIWGPKAILRIRPFKNLRQLKGFYLYGEYAYLIRNYRSGNINKRDFQPRENVGIGWTTNFGKGAGMTTEFLYDLYNVFPRTYNSFFAFPFSYRIGFYYGF
jgi:hypothetical protein